jgi:hypothetical protein
MRMYPYWVWILSWPKLSQLARPTNSLSRRPSSTLLNPTRAWSAQLCPASRLLGDRWDQPVCVTSTRAYAEHSLSVTGLRARPVSRTPSTEPAVFPAGHSQQMTRVARALWTRFPLAEVRVFGNIKGGGGGGEGTAATPSTRCPSVTSGEAKSPHQASKKERTERERESFAVGQRWRWSLSVTRVTGPRHRAREIGKFALDAGGVPCAYGVGRAPHYHRVKKTEWGCRSAALLVPRPSHGMPPLFSRRYHPSDVLAYTAAVQGRSTVMARRRRCLGVARKKTLVGPLILWLTTGMNSCISIHRDLIWNVGWAISGGD